MSSAILAELARDSVLAAGGKSASMNRKQWRLAQSRSSPAPLQGAVGPAGARLNALLAAGKAITKPEEIVKAARYARVDILFLGGDDRLWGRFDEAEDRVIAHGSAGNEDIDLLDYAALMTLRQGGSVTLVERTTLPPPGLSAAILRY